jgi:hypothetical protein
LVSDRNPIFISRFWRELFRLCGTKLRMSTAYHPQTDGQTEVFNRVLEQYLRAFVHKHPHQWYTYLNLAEWSYNTSVHSSTGFSPFEITFGKPPPSIPHYLLGSSTIEAVDTLLTSRQHLITKLRNILTKAQNRIKQFADNKRRDTSFELNSWVYVKLCPYRQKTPTSSPYTKLSPRYYGPFKILSRIGPVAYKLDLPPTSKIHPVFHCSLLKPHHGPITSTAPSLPPSSIDNHPIITPLAILSSKWDTSVDPPIHMVLVQWQSLSLEDTSWEPWSALSQVEDKVILPAVGDVSSPIIINTSPIEEQHHHKPNETNQPN